MTSAPETIRYDGADDDGVARITLHRPERLNAFTNRMQRELCAAFDVVDADAAVRAVVVTGSGRAFCAGADLGSGERTFSGGERSGRDPGGVVTLRIFESTKPVIAAVNGPAVGVGASITLAMDARIAAPGATFGFVFTRLGIVPEACSSWFLPRLVGIPTALDWLMSGARSAPPRRWRPDSCDRSPTTWWARQPTTRGSSRRAPRRCRSRSRASWCGA